MSVIMVRNSHGVTPPAKLTSYSSSFPNTENPFIDGGKFFHPASASWAYTMQSVAGRGIFIGDTAASGFNDAVAFANPSVFSNTRRTQSVTLTSFVGGAFDAATELEIHLLSTETSSTTLNTYEVDLSVGGSGLSSVQKWHGAQGTFTPVTNTGGNANGAFDTAFANGQTWVIAVSDVNGDGSLYVFTIRQNGVLILQAQDDTTANIGGVAPFLTGTWGFGADNCSSGPTNVGWSDVAWTSS